MDGSRSKADVRSADLAAEKQSLVTDLSLRLAGLPTIVKPQLSIVSMRSVTNNDPVEAICAVDLQLSE